jgi:hypothetical protein
MDQAGIADFRSDQLERLEPAQILKMSQTGIANSGLV